MALNFLKNHVWVSDLLVASEAYVNNSNIILPVGDCFGFLVSFSFFNFSYVCVSKRAYHTLLY